MLTCDHPTTRACAPDPRLLPGRDRHPATAQARYLRRHLAAAAEHGIALLEALGLPRLVTPGAEPIDPAELGDAVDRAIAALDEADAPSEDLEEGGDEEPALGWPERMAQAGLGGSSEDEATLGWGAGVCQLDLGRNTEDGEHSLGAPERHPHVGLMTAPWFEPAAGGRTWRCGRGHSQVSWAQGERQDGEGEAEAGYDLACDDDELDGAGEVDAEPSLGWPEDIGAKLDPARQSQAHADREFDQLDAVDIFSTIEVDAARRHAKQLGRDLVQRARAVRRGEHLPEKPATNLIPIALRIMNVGHGQQLVGWRL